MADPSVNQNVQIEIEDENEDNEESIEVKAPLESPAQQPKPSIPRKRITELTEDEKQQLIANAKNGIDNENYNVRFFKNGNTHITLKKQTKAQELIKLNETNSEKITLPSSRYLTDNQLLFEHIINLETQYGKLHAKHKKLKKRYNELEGYLYADDSDDEKPKQEPQPIQQPQQVQPVQQVQQVQQQNEVLSYAKQPQLVQRRYVRSWRQIQPIQNQM